MKLERHEDIPDLKAHWQGLFTATGGYVQGKVGYIQEHQVSRRRQVVDLVREYASRIEDPVGLEIGCCEGVMTQEMAPLFSRLIAVDFLPEFFELVPELPNVTYEEHDIRDWTPDFDVDIVIVSEVLEHIPDPVDVLKRFAPHTTYFIATCPVNESLTEETWEPLTLPLPANLGVGATAGHVWAMDQEGFVQMFLNAGLRVVQDFSDTVAGFVVAQASGAR